MFGSGREALPDDLESSEGPLDVREWSGGPSRCSRVVGKPSRMTWSGQEARPNVQ